MAIVDFPNRADSFEVRGRVGLPVELGNFWCGWSVLGDDDTGSGIYQRRPRQGGQIIVKMRHYWPNNPQYEDQQAWRGVFADAVSAWQALTTEQKLEWKKKKWPRKMTGYNRFLRAYLKTH
jgi:hypothetical protein